ncbi:MAG: hypothetical protein HYX27_05550 [Acidobacteria bacterium]|nr:hypothetical protein [Acidobacteriota bacterium]
MLRSVVLLLLASACALPAQTREQILSAMKKASTFYLDRVSTQGGYHYTYTDDLSYGRSEHSEGPTQVETQREGTPVVGMAYLEAWQATGDRFYLDAAVKAARAGVAGQLCSGGWDYIIEFDPAKRANYPYRADGNCKGQKTPPTTLDDNVSQEMVRLLMRVDRELKFRDAPIHEAALYALDTMLTVQYPNGAWPQRFSAPPDGSRFPVKKASYPESWSRKWPGENYKEHYTFNDNSIADMIDMYLEAGRIYGDKRFTAAAEKGGGFILLAQMPEPQPAWAQQYDAEMHPAWARLFEPPSVTGGESQGIMQILMVLYRETGERKYLDAVGPALAYLEKSVLPGGRRIPRFMELKTNRALYITKGTQIQAKGLGSARIDGYQISYDDKSVITHYGVITGAERLPRIRKEYDALRVERKARPDRLHGLSPWMGDELVTRGDAAQIIRAMDDRGAWVEEGQIGKADKVVSVFVAHDMVLTINGRAIPVKENDRIELFDGPQPPRQKIIRSATFVRNLERLAAALGDGR